MSERNPCSQGTPKTKAMSKRFCCNGHLTRFIVQTSIVVSEPCIDIWGHFFSSPRSSPSSRRSKEKPSTLTLQRLSGEKKMMFKFHQFYVQLFRETLSEKMCTWQSWNWGVMGSLDCSWTIAVEHTFVSFSSARKHTSTVACAILSNFWTENLSQYLLELSRVLCPTTFLEIAV